jgi:hypothetical protein
MGDYLSIVATTRNDNHGGDLMKRTNAFVNSVYEQSLRTQFPIELILVEWNPPSDKPPLKDVLLLPLENEFVELKIVTVPEAIHAQYKNGKVIPLYQMIAKNVGIKQAKGVFILCTNIDILFSDQIFDIFASKKFEKGNYYRANRCDVPKEVMDFNTLKDQLHFSSKNIINRMGKTHGQETLTLPSFFYKFPRMVTLLNSTVKWLWLKVHKDKFPHFTVDFNACGDFTLMSREDWELIQGYPELDMYSIHIDSMGLWAANAMGIKQIILPYSAPVYHIYHEDGWESTDALRTIVFLQSKPCLDYSIVFKAGMQIVQNKQTWNINDEFWGLSSVKLPIFEFNSKSQGK